MHYIHKVWKLKRNKYRKFSPTIQLKRICGKNRNDNLSIKQRSVYLSREELIDVYSQKWLLKHRLQTPCIKLWKSSPFAMLNAL